MAWLVVWEAKGPKGGLGATNITLEARGDVHRKRAARHVPIGRPAGHLGVESLVSTQRKRMLVRTRGTGKVPSPGDIFLVVPGTEVRNIASGPCQSTAIDPFTKEAPTCFPSSRIAVIAIIPREFIHHSGGQRELFVFLIPFSAETLALETLLGRQAQTNQVTQFRE